MEEMSLVEDTVKLQSVKVRSIIRIVCLMTSTGCLCIGYSLAGYWLIFPVFLLMGFLWVVMKKGLASWLEPGLLLFYVFLAAVGITLNLSSMLMLIS